MGEGFPPLKEVVHSITAFNKELYFAIYKRGLYRLKGDTLNPVLVDEVTIENALVYKKNKDTLWILANQGSFLIERNGHISSFEKLPKTTSSKIVFNKYGVFGVL